MAACVLMLLCKIHSHLKRSLIYVRTQRIFIVAKVIKSAFAAFITGKVETLGSTFRHETAGLLPSSCYYIESIIKLSYRVRINAQSDTLALQTTIPPAQLVVQGFPYTNKYPFQYDLPHKYLP